MANLTAEERKAFEAIVTGTTDETFEKDPLAAMEAMFAAGRDCALKRVLQFIAHERLDSKSANLRAALRIVGQRIERGQT